MRLPLLVGLVGLLLALPESPTPSSWELYPPTVELRGLWSECRLVAVGQGPDRVESDLTSRLQVTVADSSVAEVVDGVVRPKRTGTTTLRVSVGGQTRTVPVTVRGCDAQTPLDFERAIIPVLTKHGCNSGACHGAASGRGGFRLSLFGYDPPADYDQIVKSHKSRRVVLGEPERSLLLLKPTLQLDHGGGLKLPPGPSHGRLLHWLEQGAPEPRTDGPRLTGLVVQPSGRHMRPEETQRLRVEALWSDGTREDVTALAQYDSLTEGRAQVSPDGEVRCTGKGEGFIMIRYMGQATVFSATAPFAELPPSTEPAPANLIDRALQAKWASLGLRPSPPVSDEKFLRRLYLDVIGTLPSPAEVRAFLADNDAEKRTKVIDALLQRPEFIDYWALKWGDMLRNNRVFLEEKGMWSLHRWLRTQVRDNVPVDEIVRRLLTAQGSTFREGPANFFRIGTTAPDWAEATSQVFLGVRLQCAKCHHHPFEKWSQDDYHGLAACFVRVGTKPSQEYGLFGRETVIFLRPEGEARHPRRGTIVKPQALDGPPLDDGEDRRERLAEWIVSPENPFFARNIVNRVWAHFMGRGLVEPVDDLRSTNPASVPALLDGLAQEFRRGGHSLRALIRAVVSSQAYQLSSGIIPENAADAENIYFTRYRIKRLAAEQLADGLDDATGTQEKYPGLPLGTRAIQLPDSGVRSYLLDVFGRPPRQLTCECERVMSPNIGQALHLINGDFINGKIARAGGRIDRLFKAKAALPEVVEQLYLATLSRPPTEAEVDAALTLIKKAPTPRVGAEDLLWALINSREFLFVH